MQTLLLLAGQSRRFWPLEEKSLFPICGKTLAEHQVETLKAGGMKDIILVVGSHNKKGLKKLFPRMKMIEQKGTGMWGACMTALPKIKGPVMIVSGNDTLEHGAFEMLCKEAAKSGVAGAILARKVKTYFPGGYLTVKSGRSISIVEKPGAGKEPSRLVNIVAHVHNDPKALLAALKKVKNHKDDGYEQALHLLFKDHHYRAVAYEGLWQPVKYPWHLLPLLDRLLVTLSGAEVHKTAKIHPSAVIEGAVTIGEGARVMAHATVKGPCVIGKRCVIGNNALVRGSSVGDDCVIGYNSEVKGSILAGPVWTHMTYLGDSIIGRNVSFGGGSTTGNLRLDEAEISSVVDGVAVPTGLTKLGLIAGNDTRFSLQSSCYPGVKVGRGSFISDAALLRQDVPDGSYVNVKDGIVQIRPNKTSVPKNEDREKYRKQL